MKKSLIFSALLLGRAMAQTADDFQCGVLGEDMDPLPDGDFSTVRLYYDMDGWGSRGSKFLMPGRTHWHVYAIPEGETARYSSTPPGFMKPRIRSGSLRFPAQKNSLDKLGYSKGDKIEAAVNLFIPVNQLRNIRVDGVDMSAQVFVTDEFLNNATDIVFPEIKIRTSGVDNRIYVNAPDSRVLFTGSGVENTGIIEAAPNSQVELSGVDQKLYIQSLLLSKVTLSGIDQDLLIEGDYDNIKMSGIDGLVRVNGPTGCNSVDISGIDNQCRTTDETIEVPELVCLAESKVQKGCFAGWCSPSDMSTGAWVGVSLAILAIVGLCLGLCGYYVCGCCRKPRSEVSSPPTMKESTKPPPAVMDAEIVEIEPEGAPPVDPEYGQTTAKVY